MPEVRRDYHVPMGADPNITQNIHDALNGGFFEEGADLANANEQDLAVLKAMWKSRTRRKTLTESWFVRDTWLDKLDFEQTLLYWLFKHRDTQGMNPGIMYDILVANRFGALPKRLDYRAISEFHQFMFASNPAFTEAVIVTYLNLFYMFIRHGCPPCIIHRYWDAQHKCLEYSILAKTTYLASLQDIKLDTIDWEAQTRAQSMKKLKEAHPQLFREKDDKDKEKTSPDKKKAKHNQTTHCKTVSLAEMWFNSSYKQQYDRIGFKPQPEPGSKYYGKVETFPDTYFNTWKGMRITQKIAERFVETEFAKLGLHPVQDINKIYYHIKYVWCAGNNRDTKFAIQWLASILQKPWVKLLSSLMLRGAEGIGKNFVTGIEEFIVGPEHSLTLKSINELTHHFNSHLEKQLFVILDEMNANVKDFDDSSLKFAITGKRGLGTKKGEDSRQIDFWFSLACLSNQKKLMSGVTEKTRRYFMLDADTLGRQWIEIVVNKLQKALHLQDDEVFGFRKQKLVYFKFLRENVYDEEDTEVASGPLTYGWANYLYKFPIDDFMHSAPPETNLLQRARTETKSELQKWWENVLRRGYIQPKSQWSKNAHDWLFTVDERQQYEKDTARLTELGNYLAVHSDRQDLREEWIELEQKIQKPWEGTLLPGETGPAKIERKQLYEWYIQDCDVQGYLRLPQVKFWPEFQEKTSENSIFKRTNVRHRTVRATTLGALEECRAKYCSGCNMKLEELLSLDQGEPEMGMDEASTFELHEEMNRAAQEIVDRYMELHRPVPSGREEIIEEIQRMHVSPEKVFPKNSMYSRNLSHA